MGAPLAPAAAVVRQLPPTEQAPRSIVHPAGGVADTTEGAVSQDVSTAFVQAGETVRADLTAQTESERIQANQAIAHDEAQAQIEQARIQAQRDEQIAQLRATGGGGGMSPQRLTILPDTSTTPGATHTPPSSITSASVAPAPLGVPLWGWGLGVLAVGGAGYVLYRQSQERAQPRANPYGDIDPYTYRPQRRAVAGWR